MTADDELRQAREQVAGLIKKLRTYAEAAGQRDALLQELEQRRQAQDQALASLRSARNTEKGLLEALDAARGETQRAVAQRAAMLTRLMGREEEVARLDGELGQLATRHGELLEEAERLRSDAAQAQLWKTEAAKVPGLQALLQAAEEHRAGLSEREAEVARASRQLELGRALGAERDALRGALEARTQELDLAHRELSQLHDLALRAAEQTRAFARVQQTLTVREEELQVARVVARDHQRRLQRLLPLRSELAAFHGQRQALQSELASVLTARLEAERRALEAEARLSELQSAARHAPSPEQFAQLQAEREGHKAQQRELQELWESARAESLELTHRLQAAEEALAGLRVEAERRLRDQADKGRMQLEAAHRELELEQERNQALEEHNRALRTALAGREAALARLAEVANVARRNQGQLRQAEAELRGHSQAVERLSGELSRGTEARHEAEVRCEALAAERDRLRARLGQLSGQVRSLMQLPQLAEGLQQQLQSERETVARLEDQLDALRSRSHELQGVAQLSQARERELSGALASREEQARTLHSKAREALQQLGSENLALKARLEPPPSPRFDPLPPFGLSTPSRWLWRPGRA